MGAFVGLCLIKIYYVNFLRFAGCQFLAIIGDYDEINSHNVLGVKSLWDCFVIPANQ
jgi:hypothetical protein